MANAPTSGRKNKGSRPCFLPSLPEGNQGHTENTLTSLDLTLLGSSSSSVYTSSLLTTSCEPSSNSTYQGNKGLKLRYPVAAWSTLHSGHFLQTQEGFRTLKQGLPCLKSYPQTGHRAAPALKRLVTDTLSSPLPRARTCPASGSKGN